MPRPLVAPQTATLPDPIIFTLETLLPCVCLTMVTKVFFSQSLFFSFLSINPNGCFDACEVKGNKDIFKYQKKVKLISQFQRFFKISNGLLEFALFP